MRYALPLLAALSFSALLLGACSRSAPPPPREAGFSHVAHARAGVHCTRCHGDVVDSESAAATHLPASAICAECHAEAHPGQADRDCAGCHVDRDTEAALAEMGEALRFDHRAHLGRTQGECVGCHRGAIGDGAGRGAIPAMDDCATCHQPWIDGLACSTCHVSLAQYPLVPVSHQAHTGDFLRRHGLEARLGIDRCGQCHAQSFCADCHNERAPLDPATAWADRPDRGFIHRPGYVERHAWEARQEGTLCLGCHSETSCQACHGPAGRGPGGLSPHPAGWASPGPGPNEHAAAARRDLVSCAACHSGPGGDLCVTCHAPGRPGGSPHGDRTPAGDPAHDRPCRRCHGGGR